MAFAKICDRCKEVYGKNSFIADFGDNKCGTVKGVCIMFEETSKRVEGDELRRNAYFDLCDDCSKLLNNFLAEIII